MKIIVAVVLIFVMLVNAMAAEDINNRIVFLKQVSSWLPAEGGRGAVSRLDATWQDWVNRTGELPPDFNAMPSLPFLPNPLVLDEGGANIPIKTSEQWQQKRKWIGEQARHWLTGTFPPGPNNLEAHVLSETKDGDITIRIVELRFGPPAVSAVEPEYKAKMTVGRPHRSGLQMLLIGISSALAGFAVAYLVSGGKGL